MTIKVVNGPIIRAGESLSEPLDCTAGQIVRIHIPSNWQAVAQPSPLSFQISVDGNVWYDLFDTTGHEVTAQSVVANTAVLVQVHQVREVWIKFRSGWRANPLPQPADVAFSVAIELASSQGASALPGFPTLPLPPVIPVFHLSLEGQLTVEK